MPGTGSERTGAEKNAGDKMMIPRRIRMASCRLMLFSLACWMLLSAIAGVAAAREALDMAGRRVSLPENLQRVYVASPPEHLLVYAIDPGLLVGLNFPVKESDRLFLDPDFCRLPVIGGYFGQGNTPNMEILLKTRPELVIYWDKNPLGEKFEAFMAKFDIPVAHVNLEALTGYPHAMRVLGRLLAREERTRELATYAERMLDDILTKVAAIPVEKRPKVYYAEGADGLSTDGEGSWHAELIGLGGGRNVHRSGQQGLYGMEKISIEQVLLYQPEVIFVQERSFFERIFSEPQWSKMPAVMNGRVYLIPKRPFNWFDRPPSFMRILGLQWVAAKLHPEIFGDDLVEKARDFYRVFLRVDLSGNVMRSIMEDREVQRPCPAP
jgi:iron complex transport system substrate-binding protein